MGKDKKLKSDNEKKQTPFYYETIGFISIIIVIIVFGRLGKIGSFLTITFMIIFGDWYWLYVLMILIFGVTNILTHKSFNFKNQRFVGFVILCMGLSVISHFGVHKIVVNRNLGYLQETINHYLLFLKTRNYNYVLGGGILGGSIFFIIYYLLGIVGVLLVSGIIIVLGTTMLLNKSLVDIFNFIVSKMKKFKSLTKNFNNYFKYEIGKVKEKPVIDIYSKSKVVNLKVYDNYQHEMNYSFQEKHSIELKSLIVSVLNNLNIEYREIGIKVSYAITTFKYYFYNQFDIKVINDKLSDLLEEKVYVSRFNNSVFIEISNKYVSLLSVKNLLSKQAMLNTYIFPFGINTENEMEEIDMAKESNLLIVGEENSGIRNFIYYFVCALFSKVNVSNYEIDLYDPNGDFKHLQLFKRVSNINVVDFCNDVIKEIETRTETIKKNKVQTIDEYNKILENDGQALMKRKYVIFNYHDYENNRMIEDKLMYIMQMGHFCGVIFIIICRKPKTISNVIISTAKIKLCFKLGSVKDSIYMLSDPKAHYLDNKGEAILLYRENQTRIQTPIITDNEIDKVIKSF